MNSLQLTSGHARKTVIALVITALLAIAARLSESIRSDKARFTAIPAFAASRSI